MTGLLVQAVIAVAGAMAVVLAGLRALRRGGGPLARLPVICLLAHRSVGQGANLVLAEIDGRRLLIGVTRSAITLIDSRPVAAPLGPAAFDTSFSAVLRRAGA